MMWQPLDTAPKDGTKILLGRFVPRDKYNGRIRVDWWHDGKKNDFIGFGEFNTRYWPATHWMPLPDPPQAEA